MRRFGPNGGSLPAYLGKCLLAILILVWSLGPIILLVRASVTPERDIFASSQGFVTEITFNHYVNLPKRWPQFFSSLLNSFIITMGATVLAVLVSTMAGYGYSRWRSKGLAWSMFGLVAVRLVPPIVLTLPLFPVINNLRMNDTHLALILLYAAFIVSLGTLVMRTVIDQIPRELDEAAVADGATPIQIFTRIIVPLSRSGMVAVAVFTIVFAWNEFLFGFLFTSTKARTAPLAITQMMDSITGTNWGQVFSATILQLLPILIFVLLTRNYLIRGVTAGGVKG